jgi:large subunit ribosomal protein L22
MEVTATLRHHQASAQKVRLVVDLIRGLDVESAAVVLRGTRKAAAKPIEKLLRSAIANAENRDQNVDVGKLYVKEAFVNGGPALKRVQANTMGRAFRILKRQSHITIKLDTRKGGKAAATGADKAAAAAKAPARKPAAGAAKKPGKAAGGSKAARGAARGGK